MNSEQAQNGSCTRRHYLRATCAATALSYARIVGANDRVRMGYVGLGCRGTPVHRAFLEHADNETAAICDLKEDYMDLAAADCRTSPRRFKDYRVLLEQKDIDAVSIATPDHWHALMFIHACLAGKDVYVEKPLCLTVREGRRMVEAAQSTQRVVQVGIQRRSGKFLQEAAEFVRSGGIGHVTVAKGNHLRNDWPDGMGMPPDGPPPDEQEWNQWLGPAPKTAYNRNRSFYNFRWFYAYSGGQLTNFGVHYVDMLRWCLGKDSPRSVTASGGRYAGIRDNREVPDTMEVLWEFDDTLLVFAQYNANSAKANAQGTEMELRGTKGTMYLHWDRWEVVPERVATSPLGYQTPLDQEVPKRYGASFKPAMEPRSGKGSFDTAFHTRNFLDCVKSRGKCNCDILTGHLSTAATLIGNIAHRTRYHLAWDGRTERFTNNSAANKLLHYSYRPPYVLP